jgi:hypothetical protein
MPLVPANHQQIEFGSGMSGPEKTLTENCPDRSGIVRKSVFPSSWMRHFIYRMPWIRLFLSGGTRLGIR